MPAADKKEGQMPGTMDALLAILDKLPPLAVAFSGGLDSRFLCAACLAAGHDVLAVHIAGPHIPASETAGAAAFAGTMNLRYVQLPMDPLIIPEVAGNDVLRCYYCKKHLMQGIKGCLASINEGDRLLCDGSNEDDQAKYRPGLKALQEEKVLSPLAMAHLTKAEITSLAKSMGFPLPKEKARPCLLTRYDYDLQADHDELLRLGAAEDALFALRDAAGKRLFPDFRLRLTPEPVLQVLSWKEDWRDQVTETLARHGFPSYSVLKTQAISGYFDQKKKQASSLQ